MCVCARGVEKKRETQGQREEENGRKTVGRKERTEERMEARRNDGILRRGRTAEEERTYKSKWSPRYSLNLVSYSCCCSLRD